MSRVGGRVSSAVRRRLIVLTAGTLHWIEKTTIKEKPTEEKMDYSRLVKQLAHSNPLRSSPMNRRTALKGIGATAAAAGMASMMPPSAQAPVN